jgi:hypothetical protein
MTQLDIFSIPPADTHVVQPAEVKRLATQNARILALLQQGPATREAIAAIGRNPTARISDLRQAGYDVRVVERDYASGRTVYRLEAK